MNFEVVIADDGSSDGTSEIITQFRKNSNFEIHHVWQKDEGFRVAAIRNKAVARSSGNYLIFLDGDCLVFPDYIDKHLLLAERGYFVRGSRVMLTEDYTGLFIKNDVDMSNLSISKLIKLRFARKINRLFPLINLKLNGFRKRKKTEWYGVKTCNLGMWRDDFMAVNGFDEQYTGWGHEDADLTVRLINNGVYRKEGVNAVTVLHLWHSLNDRSNLKDNEQRLKERINSSSTRIIKGVSQY